MTNDRNPSRADQLYDDMYDRASKRTDHMFAWLMVVQWMFGIYCAVVIAPQTWQGQQGEIGIHVWIAVYLGALITIFPIVLVRLRPAQVFTRHAIAVAQVLWSVLLIHMTGGRIETHFHVFGSLAFLAVYRDWRVLVTATVVVAADNYLRGVFWPQSIYGILTASPWRWAEHTAWVVFEDVFLIMACLHSQREMREICQRRATLERINAEVEEKIGVRTKELATSNDELKQFAYVASHDLQEPLRMVSSYLQLLSKRYKGQLDSAADEYIDFAVDGAVRMKNLITDLLDYSRVGSQVRPLKPTDSESVLRRALKNLEIAIEECGAKVTVDPLPSVMADDLQLERLFQNLVGNALKYRKKDAAPEIHISVIPHADEYEFHISDNGIGIPKDQSERIFAIFQRLHSSNEYSGTGIGLAVCRKIVENHGGRIWVESEPGQGSTFVFTMPKSAGELSV